jgi:hypothetical protein
MYNMSFEFGNWEGLNNFPPYNKSREAIYLMAIYRQNMK